MNHSDSQPPVSNEQLLSSLQWRYATKAFDPARKIPAATWSALEEALVLSASSFGLQPYRFLIITDPGLRARLLPHALGQQQIVDASHLVVFAARTSFSAGEIDRYIERIVQVRGGEAAALNSYRQMMAGSLLSEQERERVPVWAARQAYIALGNLLTSAALLQVDACPMEGFVAAEFDRLLDLSTQGYTAVVSCTLGYRAAGDKYAGAAKVRFPASELIRRIG